MTADTTEPMASSRPYAIGNTGALAKRLSGGRLHLQHGPIDIILHAWGDRHCVENACAKCGQRFATILNELVPQLSLLRDAATAANAVDGSIARRMMNAIAAFRPEFITPMAAVAGSVADEILTCIAAAGITRAYVNNGGDIALLNRGETAISVGILGGYGSLDRVDIRAADNVGGVATSGWRGRSQSFGIADAVTVLATNAAVADAAATLIANRVTVDSPAIVRQPANMLSADTDLGDRSITVAVGPLTAREITTALQSGRAEAQRHVDSGRIRAAYLTLHGQTVTVARDLDFWSDAPPIAQNTQISSPAKKEFVHVR